MSLQARYTILRKIADGGTAEIFLATQKGVHGFEKPVVLKRIFSAYYADPQFRDMLVNEAHIAMSLNHSNIVQVLDLGEDDGQYILAMELVDGWTLDAVMRRVRAARSTIRPALALYIAGEVCRALAYAHAKTGPDGEALGIVHRDISPQNVLLSEQGEVKLTDFGIAISGNQQREGPVAEKIIRGKIAYMSPEQASGGALDARSDLFSVGTILYVMACGRYPFDAPTDLGVLLLVKSDEYVPPEVARPGINAELARILKRAMAKDPAERYQRADDMLMDVEQVMRSQFEAVGQTELKRWLLDLSVRDGVPVLTKAPAVASSGQSGRIVGAREGNGPGDAPTLTGGPRMPPPPSAAARSVSAVTRPAPPPAALSVKRSTTMPSTGSGPVPRPTAPSDPVHTALTRPLPVLETAGKETATPATGTAIPEPVAAHRSTGSAGMHTPRPANPVAAFRATRRTSGAMPTHAAAAPSGPLVSSGGAGEPTTPAAEASVDRAANAAPAEVTRRTRVTLTRPTTGSHPSVVAPPPISTETIAPPPVAPEILAAINAPTNTKPFLSLLPDPTLKGDAAGGAVPLSSSSDTTAKVGRRRIPLTWIGGGIVGLVALVVTVRACSRGPSKEADKPPIAAVAPVAPTSTAVAPPPPAPAVVPLPSPSPDVPAAAAGNDASAAVVPAPGNDALAAVVPAPDPNTARVDASVDQPAAPAQPVSVVARVTPEPEKTPARTPNETPDLGASGPPTAPVPAGIRSEAPSSSEKTSDEKPSNSETEPEIAKATITLNSVPPGARVTSAHHAFGTTPVVVHLRAGSVYSLTFAYDGYRPLTKRINVATDEDQEVTVTLRKAPPPPPPPAAARTPPAAPAPPGPAPAAAKPPENSWWQRMFKRN